MTGHNHYSSCTCGWCLNLGRSRQVQPIYWSTARTPSFSSYASFTNPNASCPVCGASVYFYQSPAGGRVFFDELGPPWLKHPCTDNPAIRVPRLAAQNISSRPRATWRKAGWEPIRIKSSRMEGSWHVIPVESLLSRPIIDVLSGSAIRVSGEICAFMKPWDANGWSVISFVDLDSAADEVLISIFERGRFFRAPAMTTVLERKKAQGVNESI